MQLRKLNISDATEISFIKNLYLESFPLSERRDTKLMFDLYKRDTIFTISIIEENSQYVGFLTYWSFNDFIFAEHFAISPDFRNGGFGGKVMKLFIKSVQQPIVLEVELPSTILSERRIGFYQRLGFRLWEDIPYQQPPYLVDGKPVPMKLMTYGDLDLNKNLQEVRDSIYSAVYSC